MKFNNFKMLFCLILGIVIGIGSFYIITNKGILKTEKNIFDEVKGVNKPRLIPGMTPIKWDENNNEIETTENDFEWYDYNQKKWANVKTADGSYWVWIPRYAYKIISCFHKSAEECEQETGKQAGTIDVKFLKGTTNQTTDGTVIETNGYEYGVKDTSMHYFKHPTFTFGENEIEGFWVAKFEASVSNHNSACYRTRTPENCDNTNLSPKITPNVKSWTGITLGNAFKVSLDMKNNPDYGWKSSDLDSHLMKNVEWGAVTYLTQSKYGKNNEVWVNPNENFITGCAGNTVSSKKITNCDNHYKTNNGMQTSTTGNITGIYGMSGGSTEYVAAYIDNGEEVREYPATLVIEAASKYKDIYKYSYLYKSSQMYELNKNMYGDALYETSSKGNSDNGPGGWYNDLTYMIKDGYPWLERGAPYGNNKTAGLFHFWGSPTNNETPFGIETSSTFRPVLINAN